MTKSQGIENGPFSRFYERFGDPTEELHSVYNPWLDDMASRPATRLKPFEFDLDQHPEQSIYVPKVEAVPVYPWLPDSLYYSAYTMKLMRSLGALPTRRIVKQMCHQPTSPRDSTPLPQRLNEAQQEGKNTLVVTSHINFQEFGYVRGLRHLVKRDRSNIDRCGVVLNRLMTRQMYRDKKLVQHFTALGNVYLSSPRSASAEKYGIPTGAANLTNALFKKVVRADLDRGGLELDAALTGSEVKLKLDDNGNLSHYLIPEVHPSSSNLIGEFDNALGIALVGPPILDEWQMHISELLDVQELLKTHTTAEVTDMIYSDLSTALEKFTKKDVIYTKIAAQVGRSALA